MEDNQIVVAGGGGAIIHDKAILREIRGSAWSNIDPRFFAFIIMSLVLHSSLIFYFNKVKLRPPEMMAIEKIPERFARLIIEKPLPKPEAVQEKKKDLVSEGEISAKAGEKSVQDPTLIKSAERTAAKRNVAARAANVEKKIRTVGVLGILTGVGSTARGPAVVDVLGPQGSRKEKFQDLEAALETTSGLEKTGDIDVLNRKLVNSKEVDVSHKEDIDALLTDMRKTPAKELEKIGDFVIRRPESIEGAASNNAKRDEKAIGDVVRQNRASVKLTYEKFLKRDPNLAGKITIRFTISAAGIVTDIQVLENTTQNPSFESDIIRKIKMWRFEAISDGDVTVTYPFIFQPS